MLDNKVSLKKHLVGKKILIVEDIKMNAFVVTRLLNYYGIETEIVRNGLEALNLMKSERSCEFGLIIMDIKMPIMDGLTATKKIREFNKDIPIVGLSANAFEEDVKISKDAGMNEHISKPIDVDKLILIISKLLIN